MDSGKDSADSGGQLGRGDRGTSRFLGDSLSQESSPVARSPGQIQTGLVAASQELAQFAPPHSSNSEREKAAGLITSPKS